MLRPLLLVVYSLEGKLGGCCHGLRQPLKQFLVYAKRRKVFVSPPQIRKSFSSSSAGEAAAARPVVVGWKQ